MNIKDRVLTIDGKTFEVFNCRPTSTTLEIVDCKAIKPDGTDRKAKNKSFLMVGNTIVTEVTY